MKKFKSLQNKSFIKILKDKRLTSEPQMSQRNVAKLAGVSFASVQNFEAGKKVRESTVEAIASALNFEIEKTYIIKPKPKNNTQLKGQKKLKI